MEIVNIKTDMLIPYVNNPRHNEDAVEKVMASIQEFGFKVPLVIDKNNVVVTGHTRLKAAKRLGIDEVPCVVADDLSDAQIKAFRIADNKVSEYAEWDEEALKVELEQLEELDFDLDSLSIDFSDFDLNVGEDVLNETMEEEEDELEPITIPFSRQKDIWHLGFHTVMCGDSTKKEDVEKLMNGEKADLVFTDPPYNVDYSNANRPKPSKTDLGKIKNDIMSENDFIYFLGEVYKRLDENTKDNSSFYIWYASKSTIAFYSALNETKIEFNQMIIWKKPMLLGRSRYQWAHEPCIFAVKGSPYFTKDRTKTTVWDFGGYDKSKNVHPTQKPLFLPIEAISNSSQENDIVLDLFGGSGSTLIACEETNRVNYSMELDEKYVDVIVRRYIKHKGNADDVYLTRDGKTIPFSEIEGDFEL